MHAQSGPIQTWKLDPAARVIWAHNKLFSLTIWLFVIIWTFFFEQQYPPGYLSLFERAAIASRLFIIICTFFSLSSNNLRLFFYSTGYLIIWTSSNTLPASANSSLLCSSLPPRLVKLLAEKVLFSPLLRRLVKMASTESRGSHLQRLENSHSPSWKRVLVFVLNLGRLGRTSSGFNHQPWRHFGFCPVLVVIWILLVKALSQAQNIFTFPVVDFPRLLTKKHLKPERKRESVFKLRYFYFYIEITIITIITVLLSKKMSYY